MRRCGRWLQVIVAAACIAALFANVRPAAAASGWERLPGGPMAVFYAGDQDVQTYVAPPARSTELQAQTASITVDYEGFSPAAQAAFQYSVQIWQSLLVAPIPIRVHAVWTALPRGVLGGAKTTSVYRNTKTNTWYPSALAKQLMGDNPSPGEADIYAEFNSSGVSWYLGTGQAPRGQYNLASVVLHELGHGLGITSSFDVASGQGSWGLQGAPIVYDRFVIDANGTSLLDTSRYPNPSSALALALQNGQLYIGGPNERAANGGKPARLYAPNPFQDGSSVSHLDEDTYPAGDPNALMTPAGEAGESIYNPGPIALGILADLGWGIAAAPSPAPSPSPPASTPPGGASRCFPETGQCLSGRFLAYWVSHGGLPINGYPLTAPRNEVLEDGKTYEVQWFERVRMEYHPEFAPPNDVLLGQFGRQIHPADPPVAQKPGQSYFAPTGHNMAPDFFAFWDANGGLPQFGYPLTEEFQEKLEDGKTYTVQYTERARLERHPENAPPNQIQLGQFGRRILAGGGASPSPASPAPSTSPAPLPGAQITIAPQQGPNATLFVVTGVGFAPNTTYYVQVASQDGQRRITFDDPSAKSDKDGILIAGFSFGDAVPAGTYTASLAAASTGGQAFASAAFILTGPSGPKPGPFVAITPSKAKAGDLFIITGAGFAPSTTYTLRVQTEDRKTTLSFNSSDLPADKDGVILSGFGLATSRAPGVYIAEVLTKGASPQVVAGAKFTLAAANTQTQAAFDQHGVSPTPLAALGLAWVDRRIGEVQP